MQIRDIRATPVTVPLEAPLRHANGCHWGRFVRTIVEVETDDGLVGLGEMGGGGESATAAFEGLKPSLLGRDPARLEEMRFALANPTASLYHNRTQVVAALEFVCLDLRSECTLVGAIVEGEMLSPPGLAGFFGWILQAQIPHMRDVVNRYQPEQGKSHSKLDLAGENFQRIPAEQQQNQNSAQ